MDLYTFDHVKLTPDKQITLHSKNHGNFRT